MSNMQTFPLSSLRLSPLNRRQVRDPARVQDLIASIRSIGMKQNLCVLLEGRKKKSPGVVAGGRRLLALQELAKAGELSADEPVQCEVVDAAQAVEISCAENTQRESMTPVEDIRAFAALQETGLPVEDIAARFGVLPLVVSRRLRLAGVSPKLLDACEAGDISLQQVMALSVIGDHVRQEQCWESAPAHDRSPNSLRERLMGGAQRADQCKGLRFVSIEAYHSAGGTLTADLFADHPGYIDDPMLVERLVMEKLEAEVERLRAEGWSSVQVDASEAYEYEALQAYNRTRPERLPLTDEQQTLLDSLNADYDQVSEALQEAYNTDEGGDEDEGDAEKIEQLEARSTELQEKINELEEGTPVYSDEQKAVGLTMLRLSTDGSLKVYRGLVPRGIQAPNLRDQYGTPVKPGAAARSLHGEKLMQLLTSERTLALQATLVADPSLALVAVLQKLVPQVLGYSYGSDSSVKINATSSTGMLLDTIPEGKSTAAGKIVTAALNDWQVRFSQQIEDGAELLDMLLLLTVEERQQLLALCVAASLDVRRQQDHVAEGCALSKHAGLDMRRWWVPTAARYFTHLSKSQILSVLSEAGIPTAGLDKLKKAELAGKAEALMKEAGSGWLPGPLRA